MEENKTQELEKKISELEEKLKKKEKKNFNWVNLIAWAIIIFFFYYAWTQIQPTLKNLNYLTGSAARTFQKADQKIDEAGEVIDKVNHPIKNIDKFNPF